MTMNDAQMKLYKLYQMDWMLKHGYKLPDVWYAMDEQSNENTVYNYVIKFYEQWTYMNEEISDIPDRRMILSFHQFKTYCINNERLIRYLTNFVTTDEQKIILNMISSYKCMQSMRHSRNFYC